MFKEKNSLIVVNYSKEKLVEIIKNRNTDINNCKNANERSIHYKMNEKITKIEEIFNIKLPKDYIEYMKSNNGYTGMINDDYYDIWKLEDIISRNSDYQVQEFFPNLIYFGSDGGDEAFAFDKSNNMSIVSIPFIGTEDDKIIIADSFNNFINK